jgi:Ca2+-binding EF-hand superfamily protein
MILPKNKYDSVMLTQKRKVKQNFDADTLYLLECFFKLYLENLEFIEHMKNKEDLDKIFGLIDYENNGYITLEEVKIINLAESDYA